MTKRDVWLAAALSIAIGLAEPYVELAWKCRAGFEAMEPCVWGKAYFRVAQVATIVILSPLLFGLWFLLTRLATRK